MVRLETADTVNTDTAPAPRQRKLGVVRGDTAADTEVRRRKIYGRREKYLPKM